MHYTIPATSVTAGEIISWIERLVAAVHPGHGIEYWSPGKTDYSMAGGLSLAAKDEIPGNLHHVGVYVRRGMSEGLGIEIVLCVRGDPNPYRHLAYAKTFDQKDKAWAIARLISDALEDRLLYGEQWVLPDLWEKLPRENRSWVRNTSLVGTVTITPVFAGPDVVVTVTHESGRQIDSKRLGTACAAEAYMKDWALVLQAQPSLRVEAGDAVVQGETA